MVALSVSCHGDANGMLTFLLSFLLFNEQDDLKMKDL
jgi:hypothetical protein